MKLTWRGFESHECGLSVHHLTGLGREDDS